MLKGEKGKKGDKGDDYIITEADKQEIKEALSADISELKGDIDAEANERKEADNAINESLESHDTRLNALENLVRVNKIYGFHLDNNESDPDAKITYLEDAVGSVPAKMDYTSGAFDYGSWLNAFFMPRPCMVKYSGQVDYYLNPDNYAQKEDGTESDIEEISGVVAESISKYSLKVDSGGYIAVEYKG